MTEPQNGGRVWDRLDSHLDRIRQLEKRTENVNVLERTIIDLQRRLDDLDRETAHMRNAALGAAITFAVAAAGVILTIALTAP